MRKDIIKLSASLVVSLGLFFLYFDFLTRLAIVADWSALSEIESIILVTQILRAIILAVLGTKYQLQPIIPIIVFSLEALLIPGLLILIIMTGEAYYASLMGLILTAWFGASAIILTPYSIFSFTRSMNRDYSLSNVIFIGILEFVSALFLAELLQGTSSPVAGLAGLGNLIISEVRTYVGSGGFPSSANDILISIGLVLFFLGMLFFFTAGGHSVGSQISIAYKLAVPLSALLISLIWTIGISQIASDVFLIFTIPAVGLAAVIWGAAREK